MGLALPVLDVNTFSDRHTRYRKSLTPVPSQPAKSGLFVLKDAKSNAKLGRIFTKGPWIGAHIYTLTLEERATCWTGCANLDRCYGDGMPFAYRYPPGPALEQAIRADVHRLATKHPTGFAVRLHVLGDFYSVAYVRLWQELLAEYPALRVWGYTHWRHASDIGAAVSALVASSPKRASILRSDATEWDDPLPKAITVGALDAAAPSTVSCPEQMGRAPSCAACGLCMLGRVSVSFHDHSRAARTEVARASKAEAMHFIADLIKP